MPPTASPADILLSFKCNLATSFPSSPYINCTIFSDASLTVPSYSTFKSCNAETNLLYKYPDLGVLKAVSIKASLPVIAPKKNSVGFNPLKNEDLMNPLASGVESFSLKKDNVLLL